LDKKIVVGGGEGGKGGALTAGGIERLDSKELGGEGRGGGGGHPKKNPDETSNDQKSWRLRLRHGGRTIRVDAREREPKKVVGGIGKRKERGAICCWGAGFAQGGNRGSGLRGGVGKRSTRFPFETPAVPRLKKSKKRPGWKDRGE